MGERLFVVAIPRDLECLLHGVGAILVDNILGRSGLVRCRNGAMGCECQQESTSANTKGVHDSGSERTGAGSSVY